MKGVNMWSDNEEGDICGVTTKRGDLCGITTEGITIRGWQRRVDVCDEEGGEI